MDYVRVGVRWQLAGSPGDILDLATSWIPALDGVPLLPPPVVKSKDMSTYHSHLTLSTVGGNGATNAFYVTDLAR